MYKDDLGLIINENEVNQIVFNTIGKISPYIDTLDSLLLSRPMDNKDRIGILSSILISSLSSSNPGYIYKRTDKLLPIINSNEKSNIIDIISF